MSTFIWILIVLTLVVMAALASFKCYITGYKRGVLMVTAEWKAWLDKPYDPKELK